MFMPFLQKKYFVFDYGDFYAANFNGSHTIDSCKSHRGEPKLAFTVTCSDMDMGRLVAFVGVEMKAPIEKAQNSRHCQSLASECVDPA